MPPSSPHSPVGGLQNALSDAWNSVRSRRGNALLLVADATAETTLEALRIGRTPVTIWRPGSPLLLSAAAGTLILQDVGALTHADQRSLCEWLEVTGGRTRVISTTVQPIFPLVEAGAFSPTLYYRLNVLFFDMSGRHPP
jgi:transcriptional regulator of acetoin/glycerol metabolism